MGDDKPYPEAGVKLAGREAAAAETDRDCSVPRHLPSVSNSGGGIQASATEPIEAWASARRGEDAGELENVLRRHRQCCTSRT